MGNGGFQGSVSEQADDGSFKEPLYFRMMGFLYSEFPFSVGDHAVPAGAWAIQAFNESLRLVGNDETRTQYDPARMKQVPVSKTIQLPLGVPLPTSIVGEKATAIPHFTIALVEGDPMLQMEGNEWMIAAHP